MSKPSVRLPVSEALRDPVEEPSIPRMWRGIEERSARRSGLGLRPWMALPAAAVVVLALVFSLTRSTEDAPAPIALTLKDGAPIPALRLAPVGEGANLELTDGSRIHADPGTELEPLAVAPRELVLRLSSGNVTFDVVPGGPRRWIVEAGIARVEVVGTRFRVTRSARSVRVGVEHGVVLVRASSLPDGVASLRAGESVEVPAESSPPAPTRSATSAIPDAGSRLVKAPSWREQARLGKHAEAYGALGSEGFAREAERAATPDDLFTLADVARLSGHPGQAIEPLERFVARYPGDARASLAALTLGRIQLDLGRSAAGAQSLQRALSMGVPGGLVEDVYARLVEAQVKSGQTAAARVTADEYAKRFPNGRKKASIEAWFAH
jgi:transmembrane sensor